MRIVTVARKPCAETSTVANVVENHAGALNIDASRVGFSDAPDMGRRQPNFDRMGYQGNKKPTEGVALYKEGGRWPANLLLVHRPGCRVVGTRKVSTGTAVRRHVGHSTKGLIPFARGTRDAEMRDDVTYADADGKETVPRWACEDGCPVAALDRQSGTLKSGSGTVKRSSGSDRGGNKGPAYGGESRPDGTPQIWYGDEGGASRFFKQFKPG